MYSTGNDGTDKIHFRVYPYNVVYRNASTSSKTAYDTSTTGYCQLAVGLIKGYTPSGALGTSGTFTNARTITRWILGTPVSVTNFDTLSTIPLDTVIDYYYYIDKTKIIIFTKLPDTYSISYNMLYFGIPDTILCSAPKENLPFLGIGCIPSGFGFSDNYCIMQDCPDCLTGVGSYGFRVAVSCFNPYKNPSKTTNKCVLSELHSYDTRYGLLTKLDGIYGLASCTTLANGDTITVDGATYTYLSCYKDPNSDYYYDNTSTVTFYPFGCYGFAIKVS